MRSTSATGLSSPADGSAVNELATSKAGTSKRHSPGAQATWDLRVLVVDDEPMNLQDAVDLLSHWGIVPAIAHNGAEALALAGNQHFDLILMDITMPVMSGLEATQEIRQIEIDHPERQRTPIVAYTSGTLLRDIALQARVGFDEAIKKPGSVIQIEACLRRLCLAGPDLPILPRDGATLHAQR